MDPRSLLAGLAGGAPAPGPADQPTPGDQADPMAADELLVSMLKLATLYKAQESDHGDLLKIEKATTLVQQILADHQSNHDQLLGGNYSTIRRLAG